MNLVRKKLLTADDKAPSWKTKEIYYYETKAHYTNNILKMQQERRL